MHCVANISDVAAAFHNETNLMRLEEFNITSTFDQRAYTFFRNMYRKGGPMYYTHITKELKEKYKDDIIKTPPEHFTEVYLNVSKLVSMVTSAIQNHYSWRKT